MRTQPTSCFAAVNGVTLHHRVLGPADGPAVVLVNSLGTDFRIWDGVAGALAERFRVVSYDKRGHGLSDAPPGPYAIEDHLADLLGLADHLGIETFALVGVSIGGLIGMAAGARHPDRIKALVLCDAAPAIGTRQSWDERIAAVGAQGMGGVADAIVDRWFSPRFRSEKPAELCGWRNMLRRADPLGYAASCATVRDTDLTAEAGTIRQPVLMVCGGEDLVTPPATVEAAAALIPAARFALIPEAGHIPSIEAPEALAALCETFFGQHGHG